MNGDLSEEYKIYLVGWDQHWEGMERTEIQGYIAHCFVSLDKISF